MKKVEELDQGMNELGTQIEDFCKHLEEGISKCQTPPVAVDIKEVPDRVVNRVVKRVSHG